MKKRNYFIKILQKTNKRCTEKEELPIDNFVWDKGNAHVNKRGLLVLKKAKCLNLLTYINEVKSNKSVMLRVMIPIKEIKSLCLRKLMLYITAPSYSSYILMIKIFYLFYSSYILWLLFGKWQAYTEMWHSKLFPYFNNQWLIVKTPKFTSLFIHTL